METTRASHLVKPARCHWMPSQNCRYYCHRKESWCSNRRPQTKHTANINGYRARGQASTVVRHKLHCWNTVYGGNCCHISICTWPFVRSSPTGPSFKNCGLSFAPLSSNCFMEPDWISFDWFKTRFPAAHLKRAIRGFRHGSAWRASTSRLTVGANGSTNRTWPSNLSCHPTLPSYVCTTLYVQPDLDQILLLDWTCCYLIQGDEGRSPHLLKAADCGWFSFLICFSVTVPTDKKDKNLSWIHAPCANERGMHVGKGEHKQLVINYRWWRCSATAIK